LLRRPFYARQALEVGRLLKLEDGPKRAVDLIEQVLTGSYDGNKELAYASGH
jgi:hypothetical protein